MSKKSNTAYKDQMWFIGTILGFSIALIGEASILLVEFQFDWLGFFIKSFFYFVQVFNQYLPMMKYFVNEYFMAAILHYMSYPEVEGD